MKFFRTCLRLADGNHFYGGWEKDQDNQRFLEEEVFPRWDKINYFKLEVYECDEDYIRSPVTMTFFPPNIAAIWVEEKEDTEDF